MAKTQILFLFFLLNSNVILSQSFLPDEIVSKIPNPSIADSIQDKLKNTINPERKTILYANLTEYYIHVGNFSEAYIYYKRALNLTKKNANYKLRTRLIIEFTILYLQNSKYHEGIQDQKEILESSITQLSDYEKMLLNSRLGFFNESIGNVSLATDYYFASLKLAEKSKDSDNIAKMYNNIGNAYIGVGQPLEARKYIAKGIKLMESEEKISIPILYNNLAKAFELLGDTSKAIYNYRKCIKTAEKLESVDAIITSGINLANIWIIQSEKDSAIYYANIVHDKALSFFENSPQMVRSLELQSSICEMRGNTLCVEQNLLSAYTKAKESRLMLEIERLTAKLSNFYDQNNNQERAYFFLKENIQYYDSVNVQEAQDLLLLKIEEKKLDSVKFASYKLETEKEMLELKISNRNIGLWLVGIILTSLSLIALLYFRNTKRKKQILQLELNQKELTILSKNKEILSANLEIEAQEKALSEIKKRLSDQLSTEYDAEFNELNIVLKQTDRFLSVLERRKYINNLIKISDNEFHNTLKREFPKLTTGEVKLATLIRLNLGTEELLDIFNISKDSLNKKRYRLRKKFKIDKEENLNQFIRSL
jgi:hypothetical protein